MDDDFERRTDVDGYSIIERKGRSPRIHLLRPYGSCLVDDDAIKVEGSRELLMHNLRGRRASECRRCFPRPEDVDEVVEEIAYADDLD